MLTSLALSLLLTGGAAQQPQSRLAVIRKAPDFNLVNQDGKRVKLSDLNGKVLLVSFVFTTCNGSCPATTHRMASTQERVKEKTAGIEFVTITLDPKRDTPEALKNYAKLFGLETDHWQFLTGSESDVNKTIADWGMWVKPLENGQLDHPSRIFLVDRKQRIREIYNVDLLRPADVLEDIVELLKEK
ncbi:MAG TPA: SCO family protein [Gemmataceae bacterium]|nr:SCO family protein [Gemmataceae bacterium]